MKMNFKNFVFYATLAGFLLVSCDNSGFNGYEKVTIKITNNSVSESKVYRPSEVKITETIYSMHDRQFFNFDRMPSTGDVNILVVPVLIPEYEHIDFEGDYVSDNDKVRSDIEKVFFGSTEENSELGFPSLKEFYYTSSYGQLNISGRVTEWFDASTLGYTTAAEITSSVTEEIVTAALEKEKNATNSTLSEFDSDNDGYIDAIWLVYSAPNYSNGGPYLDDYNFWAYTSHLTNNEPNTSSPVACAYSWASYDFIYEEYGNSTLDSHTFIHETGHLLGLNDYYSTDINSYSPTGRADMMDNNIIDHNVFSKMLLGWTKPYLVYGSGEIDLSDMAAKDALIVIQSDDSEVTNEFNPFGEYIVIELYTSNGLNSYDSSRSYAGLLAPKDTGVRIYHVDKRAFLGHYNPSTYEYSLEPYTYQEIDSNSGVIYPITNNRDIDIYNTYFGLDTSYNTFDELRLIEENGRDTFSNGGYQTNRTLFKVGDSFSVSTYSNFFVNGALNNGKFLSSTVEVR